MINRILDFSIRERLVILVGIIAVIAYGWYSTQEWEGTLLVDLIPAGVEGSILVTSLTGYRRRYPMREADRLLLATRLGGEPLRPAHGAPVRLVAPERRGFWWVKWVAAIKVDNRPAWWQPPFPPT